MINSLKSFFEVENQKMLCCLPNMDKWASKRSPEFGKKIKNSRYQKDS